MGGIHIKKSTVVEVTKEAPINISLLAKNLYFYGKQRLELEKKEKKIKAQIAQYIDEHMEKDENGNRFYRFNYDDRKMMVVRQARTSVHVSIDKLKETFASDILSVVLKERTEEYVDEQALEQLVVDDVLTLEELESVTEKNVVYATLVVEEKEEEGENVS